jgi:tRNA (adenine57-N1/adenine58-N1)-methyltransferase
LYPGCKVVESGTGSGCFSLSVMRAIAPTGHCYTFEYNPVRAETAREEFKKYILFIIYLNLLLLYYY